MQLVTWNDSSNSWSSPVGAGGDPSYEHGYDNATVNQSTGEVYTRLAFGGTNIRVFNQASRAFTTNFAEPPGGSNYGTPMEWHPNLLGGSLIWGHYWGIYRRAGSSWIQLGGSGLIGDQGPISAYNHKDDCVYMGGGGGSGGGQLRKISSSGAIAACAAPSFPLGIMDSSSSGDTSMILGSGNRVNRLVSIAKNGSIREYNEVTDSWSGVISTLPSAVINGVNEGGDWIACSVPTYGCIVVFRLASMTSVSTTAYIWKR